MRFINATSLNVKYLFFFILIFIFYFFINSNRGITNQYEDIYFGLEKYYQEDQRAGVNEKYCNEISVYYCEIGDTNLPSIIVVGDSHLTTLSRYLNNNLDYSEYSLVIFLEQGCPFFFNRCSKY